MPVFTVPLYEFNTCHSPAGSPEGGQFCATTGSARSAAFKAWFGDSKVVDEDGEPLRVFHGTTADFHAFSREKSNIESDWGAGIYFSNTSDDAAENYAGVGPDLQNKIEREMERRETTDEEGGDLRKAVMRDLVQHGGLTIPVYLRMENPAIVGGEGETRLTYELVEDENGEYVDEKGTLVDFIQALRDASSEYDDQGSGSPDAVISALLDEGDGIPLSKVAKIVKESETLGYYTNDEGQFASSEILRRALEATGFDGIIDRTVDIKFGSQRRVGRKMKGMTPDTVHYIVFEPDQIKSAIGNKGTYARGRPVFTETA